jgi:hypothetical protein
VDLSGHRKLTRVAVREFLANYTRGSRGWTRGQMYTRPVDSRRPVGPDHFAVQRDLNDVLSGGHWANFGQKHHFMRRQDGQSQYQAWTSACEWVRKNSVDFAVSAASGKGKRNLQKLGNACHAVEDSFSVGHVRRGANKPNAPGAIERIEVYAGQDKKKHSHHDEEWERDRVAFEVAKNAVKALLVVIFDEVFDARKAKRPVTSLRGWTNYRNKWLSAAPDLSKGRAHEIDLIDVHTDGRSLDEAGLAEALYKQLGSQTTKVHRVIERLDKYDNSNSDDVAVKYVMRLRDNHDSAVTEAVSRDRKLIKILYKVLDEGPTIGDEVRAIAFLKQLRSGRW